MSYRNTINLLLDIERNSEEFGLNFIDALKPSLPKFFKLENEMSPECEKVNPFYRGILCVFNFTDLFTSEVRDKLQLKKPERNALSK